MKYNELELKIATIEIQIMSLRKAVEDIIKAFNDKAKIPDYFNWEKECKEVAKQLLESKKESESEK